MVRTLLALLLFAPVALAAPVPKDFKKPPKLDGKWKVVEYSSSGRDIKTSSILNQTWEFDGEKLSITRNTTAKRPLKPTEIKVKTDAKTKPKAFDYIFGTGTVRQGVYELDGDTLVICLRLSTVPGQVRPTTLDGGTGLLRYVLKRVDK